MHSHLQKIVRAYPIPESKRARIAADWVVEEAYQVLEKARALIAHIGHVRKPKCCRSGKHPLIEIVEVVGCDCSSRMAAWEGRNQAWQKAVVLGHKSSEEGLHGHYSSLLPDLTQIGPSLLGGQSSLLGGSQRVGGRPQDQTT